jgi:2-oxoglutarate dehydrogenase E2 component (dihydrolipoamide succinyltransferase)
MILDIKVPSVGESIKEVTLSQWLKPNGSLVKLDEKICEFESDKATLELPAEVAGILIHVAKEGDDLPIGAILARIDTAGAEQTAPKVDTPTADKPTTAPATTPPATSYAAGTPSPAAAKILAENKVQPAQVQGTGKDGRITKEDATKAVQQQPAAEQPASKTPPPPPATTSVSPILAVAFSRSEHRHKMTRMRRTIAKRLVSAKNNTAMLTTFNEVDMTAILELRAKYQDAFVKKFGIKLGFMSLFAKACAKVLLEMPDVNASIVDEDIVYHDFVDISIAISTPNGLVVPPVHNCESLSLADIEKKIADLAVKARENRLSLEEMSGGTFTITNGGVFGSLMSTPILNEPQSAILGMHATKERPVVINGEIKIRPMMYLALSYDHRIIDGSTSVTFLVKVKNLLEDPLSWFLDL